MIEVPKFGTPCITNLYKGGKMETSRPYSQDSEQAITQNTSQEGLDSQFFFNADRDLILDEGVGRYDDDDFDDEDCPDANYFRDPDELYDDDDDAWDVADSRLE